MSDGNAKQKPLDAQKARDGFINQQIGDAKSVLGAGGESQGMFLFGMAMHPVVDQSSPAHTDPATGDPIPWCGYGGCGWFGLGQVNKHSRYDLTGIERIQDLNANPEVQQRMNKAIRNYFQGLTGQKLPCDCSD
jgi:hypothetical protein